ncbi:NAD-dependent epimerase/dehydratase family protein [Flavobacterium psychrophilum]|uniref:NAD-dependent epimerase/dehydratase family protein n=1 Tax=Flavobacterium psychrophilum TaxID=96345 RepID=UPI0021D416DE|nr:NAD-dependent epimerase/dehydratase family protein [Flavobacterium psychrophilum]
MKETIGIIGGSGFIGKNLTDFFLELNYNIIVVSRTYSDTEKLSKIMWIQADVSNTTLIINGLKNCQTIICLASSLIPSESNESLKKDYDLNVSPIIDFFERSNQLLELQKFIFLSLGGTIYGNTTHNIPITEDHSEKPISNYGLIKIISENYIKFLTQKTKIESFILRLSNVYGKHQNLNKPQGIIGFAFKAILQKKAIDLYDGGKVTRGFINVFDLASAIHNCITSQLNPSNTSAHEVK